MVWSVETREQKAWWLTMWEASQVKECSETDWTGHNAWAWLTHTRSSQNPAQSRCFRGPRRQLGCLGRTLTHPDPFWDLKLLLGPVCFLVPCFFTLGLLPRFIFVHLRSKPRWKVQVVSDLPDPDSMRTGTKGLVYMSSWWTQSTGTPCRH